ncbi:hypothetical protein E2C01_102135 [Portunus trituberculatus]|uniref:Uncharacterized protein n=1 Tax=Portunus trituberculatus TaxID=210409 RepID=A0A5B7KM27_PORTR|nr:hypothetical protein [Portunus trituberculatus]
MSATPGVAFVKPFQRRAALALYVLRCCDTVRAATLRRCSRDVTLLAISSSSSSRRSTPLHRIESPGMGDSTGQPRQGSVSHTRADLCLVQRQDALGVQVACHPAEG